MNGVVVAEPNAPFLKKWFFQGYQDFEVNLYFISDFIRYIFFSFPILFNGKNLLDKKSSRKNLPGT